MFSKNNWLSILIDPTSRQKLYEAQQNIIKILTEKNIQMQFDPMKQESIHMTAVFMEEDFNKINSKIDIIDKINKPDGQMYHLKFIGFELFSPKQNIIVARYECDKALSDRLNGIVDTVDKEAKTNIRNKNRTEYVPHITLGRFRSKGGKNLDDTKKISECIQEMNKLNYDINFSSSQLYLCGRLNYNKEKTLELRSNWQINL